MCAERKYQKLSDEVVAPVGPAGTLGSYGFRGEALSAVCASCRVTVATRTADEHVGRLLTMDTSGRVTEQQPVARAPGECAVAWSH